MDVFSLFSFSGGLAFFLFGMRVICESLTRLSGGGFEARLGKLTSNPVKGVLLGAGLTAAAQSSSAVTVMLVGLAQSNLLSIESAVPLIMGSNIGTTATAWLLGLSAAEISSPFLTLLKPSVFAPPIAFVGVILLMVKGRERRREVGLIMLGFAVLMNGMELMEKTLAPLCGAEGFAKALTAFENPIAGMFFGAVFTAVIQSSSASVGVLQALCVSGQIPLKAAFPIILGQNIGTCATALLASAGLGAEAKRVTAVHILFNLIGSAAGLVLFFGCGAVLSPAVFEKSANPISVAFTHSVFNIATTLFLLPFRDGLAKASRKIAVK